LLRRLFVLIMVAGAFFSANICTGPAMAFSPGGLAFNDANELDEFGDFDEFDEFDEFDAFDEFDRHDEDVFDPLYGYNRAMTTFNDRFYFWVLKPTASGYAWITPAPVRRSINNVFRNLGYPARAINNTLQLNGTGAFDETVRFIVNSTVGMLGLFDAAQAVPGIESHDTDFGLTLGRYGMGSVFHVVLPFIGPSNVRDSAGMLVDMVLDPIFYVEGFYIGTAYSAVDEFNHASLRLGEYERMKREAIDLYIFLRNAYEQNRDMQIHQ